MSASTHEPGLSCSIDAAPGMEARRASGRPETTTDDLHGSLRELVGLSRELVSLSREQLELARRHEERYQRLQWAQREEFRRWLDEHPQLAGSCRDAHELIRTLLGRTLADLVNYIDDNSDLLAESEFARSDLVDRYGTMLNQVTGMYGMLKRLVAAEQADAASSPGSGMSC